MANLRGLAAQIPNQAVLINSIVLQEARLSSEIENIVTTNDEPYRADVRFLVDAGIAKRQAASAYRQTLAGLGVLRPSKHGREMYYINDALFAELVK